jgi:hypothetical protein
LSHFYIKVIFLPRQARDKHRESAPKKPVLSKGTLALGKPIWGTEQHIGENGLGGQVPDKTDPYMRTDLPVWNWTAALGLAKGINQGYLTANQTSVLIWTPTYSWYLLRPILV